MQPNTGTAVVNATVANCVGVLGAGGMAVAKLLSAARLDTPARERRQIFGRGRGV